MHPANLPTSRYLDADHYEHASIDQDYPSYSHTALQREYRKYDSEEIWEGLLSRARERGMDNGKTRHCVEEEDNERVAPHPEEKLWEIPCKACLFLILSMTVVITHSKVGYEESTVFQIMQRSINSAAVQLLSAFARQSVPGRVFLEAKTVNDATQAIAGITELKRNQIKLVPHENMTNVLSMRGLPRPQPQTWMRMLGNTKTLRHYTGDIALVVEVTNSNLMQLWLIPRLVFGGMNDNLDRPPAHLFSADGAKKSLGDDCVRTRRERNTFIFNGNEFSAQGYLVLSQQEMDVCQAGEGIPTVQEFESFLGCEALLGETARKTRVRIQQATLAVHDRVKVVMGTFRGLVGRVVNLHVDEVDIFLPSHDIIERVRVAEVIKEFRVGDRVKANVGKDGAGADVIAIGWVTKVTASEVVFFNTVCTAEVWKSLRDEISC